MSPGCWDFLVLPLRQFLPAAAPFDKESFNDCSRIEKHENTSCSADNTVDTCDKYCKDFGTHEIREHVPRCQSTWQLEMKQRSRPWLIVKQQPACLLTDLQGFTAAQMPWGHFVGPQLSHSVSLFVPLSPMLPVLCGHVRNIRYCLDKVWLGFPINKKVASQHIMKL